MVSSACLFAVSAAFIGALGTKQSGVLPIHLRKRDSGEHVLVDSVGRERAFHGTNAIVKGPPWIPSRDGFDGLTSLTAEDFTYMRHAGLNVIRLGVMWPGVEPTRGTYNTTYLQIVREIAAEAATYGIYILADMHQDLLSERFCGEGIPLWASEPRSVIPFPSPLAWKYETDPATGLPTRQECARRGWPDYHGAFATGSAFDRLFTNYDGLRDAWGAFWVKVAETFDGAPELLGIELINEPFVGNPYANPLLLIPTFADRWRLQPAYDAVSLAIRKVRPDALIFFPGITWDRTGTWTVKYLPLGFTHAPGGADFANRSVSSVHFYTPPQKTSTAEEYFRERLKDARNLGTALFLTESCCGEFFEGAMPAAEALGISWINWEWKDFCKETTETSHSLSQNAAFGACKTGYGAGPFPNGELDWKKLRQLATPYATAIAGNFSTSTYEKQSRNFTLTFMADPSITEPTELSLPTLLYPHGFTVKVDPSDGVSVLHVKGGAEIRVSKDVAFGKSLTVHVTPGVSVGMESSAAVLV
eukprot:TRINITY_DN7354_c1_g1_i1.p1 TRINITY_DN7354_c1_g1~~TRINITY_DN7354_c1_g1_i1.p1  ORF type:complete len:546 (+),score=79.62 TRINITY_DN7354_c1_g1_i1:48-1640(+)